MTPRSAPRLAYVAWITVCLVWGTTYLAIKVGLETIPPMLLVGLRYTIAGVILMGALAARGLALPSRASWPGLALLGFLMLGLGNGGVVWAEIWVPSGLAAVIVATTPFWMVGVEALVASGDRLARRQALGLFVGFAGIVLLVWPDLNAGGVQARGMLAGLFALQVASIGWALGSSYSRRHARHENALSAAALEMLFGGLMMLVVGTAVGEWSRLALTPRTAGALLYLIVAGSITGFASYIYALKHLPVATVSLYAYINPIIAVALGSLFLGERFDGRMAMAAGIILIGVALVQTSGQRRRSGRMESEAA